MVPVGRLTGKERLGLGRNGLTSFWFRTSYSMWFHKDRDKSNVGFLLVLETGCLQEELNFVKNFRKY